MKATGFLLLTLVTAGAGYLAFTTLQAKETGRDATSTEGRLFEGLFERVNDVRSLTVRSGDESVSLQRDEGGWGLAERGGYPVPFDKVKELVVAVAQLEIDEPKTAKPENHAKLGVEDPSSPEATSSLLRLLDASGAPLAELVVGNARRGGVFVRRDGEDQVYLCKGTVAPETSPKEWVETELMRIGGDRMQTVTIQHQDGELVLVERSDEGTNQFRVGNVPEGKEEQYPGVANGVATALSYLQLDDVQPLSAIDLTDDPVCFTTYETNDGLVLEFQLALVDGEQWIHVSARSQDLDGGDAIGPLPNAETAQGDDAQAEAGAEEDAARADRVAQEADAMNARFAPWAFRIVDYKAEQIGRRMEQLVQDPAPLDETTDPFGDEPAAESPFSIEDLLGGEDAPSEEPVLQDEEPAVGEDPQGETSEDAPAESAPEEPVEEPVLEDAEPEGPEDSEPAGDDPAGQDG